MTIKEGGLHNSQVNEVPAATAPPEEPDQLDKLATNVFVRETLRRQNELIHASNKCIENQTVVLSRLCDILELAISQFGKT